MGKDWEIRRSREDRFAEGGEDSGGPCDMKT